MAPVQSLLLLSVVGGVLHWGTMLINGTFDGLSLADGKPLRQTYTGYSVIDDTMVPVIGFFDLLATTQRLNAPTWLNFEMCNILGAINTWVLIESRRRGVGTSFYTSKLSNSLSQ